MKRKREKSVGNRFWEAPNVSGLQQRDQKTWDIRQWGRKAKQKKGVDFFAKYFFIFFLYTSIKVTKFCFVFQSTCVCTHTETRQQTDGSSQQPQGERMNESRWSEQVGWMGPRANCQTLTWAWAQTRDKPVINVSTIIRQKETWFRDYKRSSLWHLISRSDDWRRMKILIRLWYQKSNILLVSISRDIFLLKTEV